MPAPRRRRPVEETILHGEQPFPGLPERPPDSPGTADPEAPIYAELARRWQAEGRTVPGLPDPVWEDLAAPRGAWTRPRA
ncbi:hypothetical protein [Streptomyces sp. Y1]|uniref:Uncharacterized protein n=1 Tax=Streptomyces sp. Y1 TaxID=3238634 RepID=A0AB39THJ3_9ACTN